MSDKQKISSLKAENKALKAQLSKLETVDKPKEQFSWKVLGVILATGLAGAMLVVGNLVFWTGRTLTDNKRYVEATQPLIQNQAIQEAIANKATTAIFNNIDVEQIAQDALPPRAQFLAPSIASQVKTFTNDQIKNIVTSNKFQEVWQTVNAGAHQRLLKAIKNYQGDGTFDINDLYGRISERLQDSKLSFLANKTLPASVGSITIVSTPNLPKAHWIVVNLWWIRLLSIALFILLTILSIWLAKNRRKMLVIITSLYALLMLATLIALRITKTIAVNHIASEYQLAATAVWDIVLKSLIQQIVSLLIVFIILAIGVWMSGSGKKAQSVRIRVKAVLSGKLHQSIFKGKENKLTIWLGVNKRLIEVVVLIMAMVSLLFLRLTPLNITLLTILTLLIFIVIETLSMPTNPNR